MDSTRPWATLFDGEGNLYQSSYDADRFTKSHPMAVTRGDVFDAAEPAATTDPAGDGTMTVEFADCIEGLVTYEITVPQVEPATVRARLNPVEVCYRGGLPPSQASRIMCR